MIRRSRYESPLVPELAMLNKQPFGREVGTARDTDSPQASTPSSKHANKEYAKLGMERRRLA